MNQIRIGAFICERRRAKGWTQNQLAQKLGITDKAISKWEAGKSMPDLSLFMPLCTLLDISLNELFAGECISDEKIKEKTDEVLMDVITNWLGHDQCQAEENDTISESILEVQNVSRIYKTDTHTVFAVNNVSFRIPPGSFVGIMGASGSGKSTLLNLIATIDKPTDGVIQINGQNIAEIPEEDTADFRREHLGFIFQEYNLLDNLTIYENIALALTIKEVPKEGISQTILHLADQLDISSVLDKFPYEVSGGQRQRCACARAIAVNPDIILADEPTGALDSHAARQLLSIFAILCRECRATILMVTHDVMAASYCNQILFMRDGEIKTTLKRDSQDKQIFFAEILKKIEWIEGENHDVLEIVNP